MDLPMIQLKNTPIAPVAEALAQSSTVGSAHGAVHDLHSVGRDLLLLGLLVNRFLVDLGEVADLAALLALGSVSFAGCLSHRWWSFPIVSLWTKPPALALHLDPVNLAG